MIFLDAAKLYEAINKNGFKWINKDIKAPVTTAHDNDTIPIPRYRYRYRDTDTDTDTKKSFAY